MNPFRKKSTNFNSVILDTCALIDGRIVDISRAGFVPSHLIVPQFVVAELQFLADKGDAYKRERARFGLDVARNIQDVRNVDVEIAREKFDDIKEVDDKLIALAKLRGSMLYTTDYNLNKVAQIEGVTVLNVNELAQALRPHRLPGERVEIKLTQVGQDRTQGVGYLEDGTMVVVERAGSMIGQRVLVEFSRVLQTQAGKMMFAVLPKHSPNKTADNQQHVAVKAPQPQQKVEQPKKQKQPHHRHQHHAHGRPQHAKQAPNTAKPAAPQQESASKPAKPGRNRHKRITPEDKLLKTLSQQQS